jgi:aspartate/methionine/tyrosine aminotransferase
LAKHYSPYYSVLGRDLDPNTEVLATAGAVAGLNCAMMSLVSEGDEVVSFEPCWPGIINIVNLVGGNLKSVPMKLVKNQEEKSISWEYDWNALEEALNEKTKVLILINPQSPTGKTFSQSEIERLTEILEIKAPQCYVVSDDVYDFCKYEEDKEYVSFANFKNNFEKTITCFNGGKRFSCTGWKVAWAIGPENILRRVAMTHETTVWNFNTLGQYAISKCFETEDAKEYQIYIKKTYQSVNYALAKLFQESNLPLYPALVEGGFSMTVEISEIKDKIPEKYFSQDYIDDESIMKKPFNEGEVTLDFAF